MMKWTLALLAITATAVSGCAHRTAPPLCGAFDIIRPSVQDTSGTKRQVLAHNRTYREVCK
jgi:hypothetical protein